jgi:hypothetical protein
LALAGVIARGSRPPAGLRGRHKGQIRGKKSPVVSGIVDQSGNRGQGDERQHATEKDGAAGGRITCQNTEGRYPVRRLPNRILDAPVGDCGIAAMAVGARHGDCQVRQQIEPEPQARKESGFIAGAVAE